MTSTNQPPHSSSNDERTHARHAKALTGVAVSLIVAWASSLLPLPWMLISGVAAIAAIVFLIMQLIAAWPTQRRRSAIFTAVFVIPACLVFAFSSLVTVAMYGPVKEYQDCVSSAVTHKASSTCEDELPRSVSSWLRI